MRKILLAALLFSYCNSFSQTPEKFLNDQCERLTNGKGATNGIRMKYNIPCSWDSTLDSRTFAIGTYSYLIPDSGRLVCGLMITKKNPNHTKADETNIFKKEWVKGIVKPLGDLINIKTVEIDGHKWAEYTIMKAVNAPQGMIYEYISTYYIVYKGVGIMLMYKTMSRDEAIGALLFINYLEMFQTLASGTHVYNFWE